MRPYPKLMALVAAPDDLVVFFAHPTGGIVVHSNGGDFQIGYLATDWDPDVFVDVHDDVVIWLTEGPKHDIEEAIAMVDKIKTLRESEPETLGQAISHRGD